jgi:hypothetical protein
MAAPALFEYSGGTVGAADSGDSGAMPCPLVRCLVLASSGRIACRHHHHTLGDVP